MVEPIKNIVMKHRKYIYILLAALALPFIGCEKKFEDASKITYFADIVINGETLLFSPTGVEYVDAGATATENDVPIEITTTSTVDNSTPGSYSVSYSATNSDGYSKALERTVIIYDADVNSTDISGAYTGNVLRNESEGYSNMPVTLTKVEGLDGIYQISDWISGFYAAGRGYGGPYSFVGYIQINASNDVVLLGMSNPWGDPFDDVTGSYDPATGTISYTANWLGTYAFVVQLVKN